MKKVTIIATTLAVCVAVSVFLFRSRPKFESIPVNVFAELIDSAEVQVVDVSTESEYDKGHISGTDSLIVIDSSYDGLTIFYPQYSSVNLECNPASPESVQMRYLPAQLLSQTVRAESWETMFHTAVCILAIVAVTDASCGMMANGNSQHLMLLLLH